MYDKLKSLTTANMKLLEEDDDIQDEMIRDLLPEEEYETLNLLDKIGSFDFKEEYKRSKDFIQSMRFKKQISLCKNILDVLEEKYGIAFMEKIDFEIKENVNRTYKFLEFIEFDYIDFVSMIWKALDVDLLEIDIEKYSNENSNRIIQEIESGLNVHKLPMMVFNFLRTNTKEVIINVFVKMTEKSKTEIRIEMEV